MTVSLRGIGSATRRPGGDGCRSRESPYRPASDSSRCCSGSRMSRSTSRGTTSRLRSTHGMPTSAWPRPTAAVRFIRLVQQVPGPTDGHGRRSSEPQEPQRVAYPPAADPGTVANGRRMMVHPELRHVPDSPASGSEVRSQQLLLAAEVEPFDGGVLGASSTTMTGTRRLPGEPPERDEQLGATVARHDDDAEVRRPGSRPRALRGSAEPSPSSGETITAAVPPTNSYGRRPRRQLA